MGVARAAVQLRRPRWSAPVLLAIVLLLIGVAVPGDAQPGSRASERGTAAAAGGGPSIPPPPGEEGAPNVIRFDPVTPSVTKAKVQFTMPKLTFAVNLRPCVFSRDAQFPPKCPFDIGVKLPPYANDFDTWYAEQALTWVAQTRNGRSTFGVFPAVRVHALAFGSIPVSATVHLSQTVHNNLYDPVSLYAVVFSTIVDVGRVLVPGYGPAPNFGAQGANFQFPFTLRGTLDVRLSDVTVDEVPVDVGSHCTTSSPARLTATVPGGYSPGTSDPLAHRDRAGGFSPVFAPATADTGGYAGAGWLDGTVDIPAFAGCRNGAEDLDPLLTGLVSGPGNPISLLATTILVDCTDPTAHCPARPSATEQALAGLTRSIRNHAGPAQIKRAMARVTKDQGTFAPSPTTHR